MFCRQGVEARGDERLQGLGDLERPEFAGDAINAATLDEDASVDEHPDGLDGIEGDAFRPFEDLVGDVIRQSLDEPVEQIPHRLRRTAARDVTM